MRDASSVGASHKLPVRRLMISAMVCGLLPAHAVAQSVNCGNQAATQNYVAGSRNADGNLMASLAGNWVARFTSGSIQNDQSILYAADGRWQGTLRECTLNSGACENSPLWGYWFAFTSSDGSIGIANNIAQSKYGASCGTAYLRRPNPDTLVDNRTGIVSRRQR